MMMTAAWSSYKISVPVNGAIILNLSCDKVLLVKGWGPRGSWGFPKGKVNKGESDFNCAAREVIEETSFDISPYTSDEYFVEMVFNEQRVRLFVAIGVPETTIFIPKTRKEISVGRVRLSSSSSISFHCLFFLLITRSLRIMFPPNLMLRWLKSFWPPYFSCFECG